MHWEKAEMASEILEEDEEVVVWAIDENIPGSAGTFYEGYFRNGMLFISESEEWIDYVITHFMLISDPRYGNEPD